MKSCLYARKSRLFEMINHFVKEKYGERIVLFLDDFYQIEFDYQPRILQYFHGIYKESGGAFCFKAVAIPNSVKINYAGQRLFIKKEGYLITLICVNFWSRIDIQVSLDKLK